jgi:hypothetical protein
MSPRKITTTNIFPPIPIRSHDWVAYFDGDEEDGPRGYGETEADARADLVANLDDLTEVEDADYLRNLSARLRRIPVMYGTDGYDIDRLLEIARSLKP